MADSYKTIHILTIGLNNLAAYPKELKSYAHINSCTQMLILALFIITKSGNKIFFSLMGKGINKL